MGIKSPGVEGFFLGISEGENGRDCVMKLSGGFLRERLAGVWSENLPGGSKGFGSRGLCRVFESVY